jgi:hypothetical protein
VLTRSLPRFLIQAALLIVVAGAAAAIHRGPLIIVFAVAAAFAIVAGTEWLGTREPKLRRDRPRPAPLLRLPDAAGPDRSRSVPAPIPPPAAAPPVVQSRRWNVFELENRARAIAGRDAARDEEISFLLLYLREFADVDGDLNEEFDTFIRESFPDLMRT